MYKIQIDEESYSALRRVGYENDMNITSDGKYWISIKEEFYNTLPVWNGLSPEVAMGAEIFKQVTELELLYLKEL